MPAFASAHAQSELWRADLLSQSGQFERSQALYGHLAKHLEQDRVEIQQGAALEQATRQSAWLLDDEEINVTRINERLEDLERELVQSQKQLRQLREAVADSRRNQTNAPSTRYLSIESNVHEKVDISMTLVGRWLRTSACGSRLKRIESRQRDWLKLRLPNELSRVEASTVKNEIIFDQLTQAEGTVRLQLGQEVDRLMDSMDFHVTMSPAMQSIHRLQIVKQTRARLALELSEEQKWLQSGDP